MTLRLIQMVQMIQFDVRAAHRFGLAFSDGCSEDESAILYGQVSTFLAGS